MGIVILGAGGHSKVIIDMIHRQKELKADEIVLLDDGIKKGTFVWEHEVKGGFPLIENYRQEYKAVIAIGNNKIRRKIAENYLLDYVSIVHPNAVIGRNVEIQKGTVVMAGAIINSGTIIGRHCIINSGSTVDHDNIIHDFVHISPGAHLGGTVKIGTESWIGIGSSISNNVTIAENVTIGAGGVVLRDIKQPGTYVGIPVKNIKL